MNQSPTDRYEIKLTEQIGFLERSCRLFDEGCEDEAFRLATTLRILFHDTNQSNSLLKQMNLKRGRMLTSSRGLGDWKDYLAYRIVLNQFPPVSFQPLLRDRFRECYMLDWWETETVFVHEGKQFPRRKIILSMANKDGGAHVDEKLEGYYEILVSGKWALSITPNLTFNGDAPYEQGKQYHPPNAHLALVRQFAYEVLCSSKHLKWPVHHVQLKGMSFVELT